MVVRRRELAPEHVEAHVRRDAIEPGTEQRAAVERVAAAPRAQERLLHGVLRLVERGEHPVAVDVQLAPVALGEAREVGFAARSPATLRRSIVHVDHQPPLRRSPGHARVARPFFLDQPRVPVGIVEGEERVVALALRIGPGQLATLAEVEQLAGVDAPFDELGPRGLDVGDAQVQAMERARRHLLLLQQGDRAGRAGRGQLHDAEVLAGAVVDVQVEADLVHVEGLGAVHVETGTTMSSSVQSTSLPPWVDRLVYRCSGR